MFFATLQVGWFVIGYILGSRNEHKNIKKAFVKEYMKCKVRPAQLRFSKIFELLNKV